MKERETTTARYYTLSKTEYLEYEQQDRRARLRARLIIAAGIICVIVYTVLTSGR
jgi:hypothetical protein